jgi:hypothetical protein
VEQPFGGRHRQQRRHLSRSPGLADDRDVAGVSAKALDVVANPLQRMHEIEHTQRGRLLEVAAADLA